MTEVIVDGVKYVPSDEAKMQVETMREVLESLGYLSTTAIEEIITKFEEFDKPQKKNVFEELLEEKKPQKSVSKNRKPHGNDVFQFNSLHKKQFKIRNISSNGIVYYHGHGRSKAKWTVKDAIRIHNQYHQGMTYNQFNQIVKTTKFGRNLVGKILYNCIHGDLLSWIEKWKAGNVPKVKPLKKLPIQNNPEKRKELGYGGIP